MASEVGASNQDISRRRSSGGLRRNASHDISDQISENKLVDLKKVASAESTFTEDQKGEKKSEEEHEAKDEAEANVKS